MRRRLALLLAAALSLGAQPVGTLIYVLPVEHPRLQAAIAQAEMMKGIHLHAGDIAWAAYYAGREAYARELLAALWAAHGIVPGPRRDL
jgi:hypothetical protein